MWSTKVYLNSSIQTTVQCFEGNYTLVLTRTMALTVSSYLIIWLPSRAHEFPKGCHRLSCWCQSWMFCAWVDPFSCHHWIMKVCVWDTRRDLELCSIFLNGPLYKPWMRVSHTQQVTLTLCFFCLAQLIGFQECRTAVISPETWSITILNTSLQKTPPSWNEASAVDFVACLTTLQASW